MRIVAGFSQGIAGLSRSAFPHRSAAMRALKSSESDKKTLVRKPCSSVRHDSPVSAERSELMLCVATIGMQRACRASEKNFSSPEGSFSPVVANA